MKLSFIKLALWNLCILQACALPPNSFNGPEYPSSQSPPLPTDIKEAAEAAIAQWLRTSPRKVTHCLGWGTLADMRDAPIELIDKAREFVNEAIPASICYRAKQNTLPTPKPNTLIIAMEWLGCESSSECKFQIAVIYSTGKINSKIKIARLDKGLWR